jgi:uncharacterized protein YbjT (DUF2867 family)
MKVVVVGGTGLIGSKVVAKLTELGDEALAASPETGGFANWLVDDAPIGV